VLYVIYIQIIFSYYIIIRDIQTIQLGHTRRIAR
jgi:hypothetical protein